MNYLLDTNIVSAYINNVGTIRKRMENAAYEENNTIFISIITHYEIRRGLLAANAKRKMIIFESLCKQFSMLWLDSSEISEKAAQIYAGLKKSGSLIPDNDIMIAATALTNNLKLITDDEHFSRIPNISIENWLREDSGQ
jgi:tRNA(fMet)-specific endonuclease VapC